jgi:hypothetical protein
MLPEFFREYFQVHFQFIFTIPSEIRIHSSDRPDHLWYFHHIRPASQDRGPISLLKGEKCAQERLNPHNVRSRAHEATLTDENSPPEPPQPRSEPGGARGLPGAARPPQRASTAYFRGATAFKGVNTTSPVCATCRSEPKLCAESRPEAATGDQRSLFWQTASSIFGKKRKNTSKKPKNTAFSVI